MAASKENFFNPAKKRNKAEETDHTARAIIAAEAKAREKKTEKLRKLRLEQQGAEKAPVSKPKKRAASTKSNSKEAA